MRQYLETALIDDGNHCIRNGARFFLRPEIAIGLGVACGNGERQGRGEKYLLHVVLLPVWDHPGGIATVRYTSPNEDAGKRP